MNMLLYTLILSEALQCAVLIALVLAVRQLAQTPYISKSNQLEGIQNSYISGNPGSIRIFEKAQPKIEEEVF